MLIRIHPDKPRDRLVRQVADLLRDGGIIIYPTDTIYAIGCSILKPKAIDRVAKLKGTRIEKANF